jgi:hypothetical protein
MFVYLRREEDNACLREREREGGKEKEEERVRDRKREGGIKREIKRQ